jgi:tetratricopeptide (TPR) repeat protein
VDTLFLYAQFLEKCERYEKAEEYFIRALEIDPNHVDALWVRVCLMSLWGVFLVQDVCVV